MMMFISKEANIFLAWEHDVVLILPAVLCIAEFIELKWRRTKSTRNNVFQYLFTC